MLVNDKIAAIPKAELHAHLEGFMTPEFVSSAIRRSGATPPPMSVLRHKMGFKGFRSFLKAFTFASSCLKSPVDYQILASEAVASLVGQKVFYSELTVAPGIASLKSGLDIGDVLSAVEDGVHSASNGITVRVIVDLVRNVGPDEAMAVLRSVLKRKHGLVVGITIGGDERKYPARLFARHFAVARDAGLGLVAHAGEFAGPESVRETLNTLMPDRLTHCVTAAKDPWTMELVARSGVTVELCPTSNLRTGVIKSIKALPIRQFMSLGIPVTINSDDPAMFGTDLTQELKRCSAAFGLGAGDLAGMTHSAVKAAFVSASTKRRLVASCL